MSTSKGLFLRGCGWLFLGALLVLSQLSACGPAPCTPACSVGQRKCDTLNNRLLVCALGIDGQCPTWGSVPCGAGTSCQSTATGASCEGTGSCTSPCNVGATQCQGNGVQTCQQRGNCPVWGPAQACPAGQSCQNGQCSPSSSCKDSCSAAGQTRCSGNATETCSRDAQGCLAWGTAVPCGAGEICQLGQCSSNCKNICTAGEKRCSSNSTQECVTDPTSQCPLWGTATPCQKGQTCQAGSCQGSACQDPCQVGQARCSGAQLQSCVTDAKGCALWGTPKACPAGQSCKAGSCAGGSSCQAPKTDCGGTCTDVQSDAKNCGTCGKACASGESCKAGKCEGGSTCKDACKAAATRCGAGGVQTCAKGTSGCLEWGKAQACPAGQSCSQGKCSSSCQNACTQGAKRCAGNKVQSCVQGGQGCTIWNGGTACPSGETCDTGKCVKPGSPASRSQKTVCDRWKKDYPITTPHGFTNAAGKPCDPGKIAAGALNDAVRRLSLYRWLVGLPPTASDPKLTSQAQACAIILSANRQNSHNPPKTWTCWNATGAAAAGKSNVFVGPSHPSTSISGFIDDNYSGSRLGHRHWCLHPGLSTFGMGFAVHPTSHKPGTCQYVTHAASSSQSPIDFIAYPPPGFVPMQAMNGAYKRVEDWSFVSTKYKVSGVKTVTLIRQSDNDTQTVSAQTTAGGGYRLPTGIRFKPRYPKAGETYTVKLGSVYTYTVKFFDCK